MFLYLCEAGAAVVSATSSRSAYPRGARGERNWSVTTDRSGRKALAGRILIMPGSSRPQPPRGRSIFAVRDESLHVYACRLSCHDQIRWLIVPLGLGLAVDSVTNRAVDAERCTVVELLVPDPTRSVVVFPGQRSAAALEIKRPVDADRRTVPVGTPSLIEPGALRRGPSWATGNRKCPDGHRVDISAAKRTTPTGTYTYL